VNLSRAVKALLVIFVVVMAAMLYPPARLAGLVLAGRSPDCSFSRAIRAEQWWQRKIETKDRIIATSKTIATDGELEQWQTPSGNFWTPSRSKFGLPFHLAEQQMDIYGDQEFGVRQGDVVLDCGANVGAFTRKALDRGARTVVAIEPAPENLECLRRTFKDEAEAGRVIIYPKGVWDKDDVLTLHLHEHNSAADSFLIKDEHANDRTVQAPLTTIDKLVGELKLERVDFIKMDIEGAEPNALKGGRGTLAKFHPRLAMSVYHEPTHPQVIPQLIREAWSGYRMECGPCALVKEQNRIRPDIMYFQ
jgi:FkbM family methyltransferase